MASIPRDLSANHVITPLLGDYPISTYPTSNGSALSATACPGHAFYQSRAGSSTISHYTFKRVTSNTMPKSTKSVQTQIQHRKSNRQTFLKHHKNLKHRSPLVLTSVFSNLKKTSITFTACNKSSMRTV